MLLRLFLEFVEVFLRADLAYRTDTYGDPSDSKYTIFEGEELFGWPDRVYLRGQLAVENGRVVSNPPQGRYVPAVTEAARQQAEAGVGSGS